MIKLLGSGGYGCVINKSIKKKAYISNYVGDVTNKEFKNDEKKNKHISKIFANTEAYCEELIIITKILYKYHKMFNSIQLFNELSLPPKKCSSYLLLSNIENYQEHEKKNIVLKTLRNFFKEKKINLETHDEKKETIAKCLIGKFDSDTTNIKIHEIIYDYGGIQLDNIEINDYNFIKALIIMCKSLQTLHQLGFVHRDIKPQNILYNNDNYKLSLIDFGLCIPFNEVYTNKEKWWVYSEYFISPPEYNIIEKDNKYKNLDIIYNTFYKNDDFYIKKKKEYDVFLNKYNNINNIEDIPEEIKKIAYKGDIYSLGISLLLLYNQNNIKITHENKELIMQKISNLINNMIITNPFDRYDLTDVVNDLFELEKLYISEIELNKYNDITCNEDIQNITNTLSLLKLKGGGKIKIKKNKNKLYKKPLKNILFKKFI
jgi:serine/threonine protein kinase